MTVFANGLEISCKAQGVKAVAIFPDVCMTPPEAPPTPPGVPIPYPNFGFDSDLTSGTGTVKIGNKEVSQENASKYSKCTGDEAGAAAKKGVVTSKNTGKVHGQMWSMNVKAEGKGVVRFSDIATSNHGSAGNTPPGPEVGQPGPGLGAGPTDCLVGEYKKDVQKCRDREPKGSHQFHHIIPDRTYRWEKYKDGVTAGGNTRYKNRRQSFAPTNDEGMCICLPTDQHVSSKGSPNGPAIHEIMDQRLTDLGNKTNTAASPAGTAPLRKVRAQALLALQMLVPDTIDSDCFELALKKVLTQTEPHKNKQVRTEFSASKISPAAKSVLRSQ